MMDKFLLFLIIQFSLGACGIIQEKNPSETPDTMQLVGKPLPPEEAKAMLNDVGGNFVYGQGIGEAALNVGTVVAFPPYAIVLIGNAALSLSGYKPLSVADALPEEAGEVWRDTYNGVTSGPGRVTAAVAGEEYRTPEVASATLKQYLQPQQPATTDSPSYDNNRPSNSP